MESTIENNNLLNEVLIKLNHLEEKFENLEEQRLFELETLTKLNDFELNKSKYKVIEKEDFLADLETW